MKNSPLRLEGYFFSHIEMRAHADGDPEANPQLKTVSELGKDPEEGRYLVTVRVEILRAEEGALPTYTGLLEVRGFFRTAEGYPPERCDELVFVNGSSILYGAARDMLLTLTGRGPWPGMLLPSVRFTDDRQDAVPDGEPEPSIVSGMPAVDTKESSAGGHTPAPRKAKAAKANRP